MDEGLYNQLKEIANDEGKSVFDVTNTAISTYLTIYNSLKNDIEYLQIYYLLFRHLISIGAINIDISKVLPDDLALLISSFLSTSESGKMVRLFGVLDFITQLLGGRKTNLSFSLNKQVVIYSFGSEDYAKYFEQLVSLVLKNLASSEITYEIKRAKMMVEVNISE